MRGGLRRGRLRAAGWVVVVLVGIGPWPERLDDPGAYTAASSFRDTRDRLDFVTLPAAHGPPRAGAAQVDLARPVPVSLAGHPGQMGRPYVGVARPCFARAITIARGEVVVTIVGADLLLVDEALARAVAARAGVDRSALFFTATHTHTGPGGWGVHPLERLVAGTYDPDEADHLASVLAEAVVGSRRRVEAAEVAFVSVPCPGLQTNRIEPGRPTTDALSAWIVRSRPRTGPARTLATLAVFGAHATIAGSDPPRLDGDYPAAFAARLAERVDAGVVLFAAGTVGDSAPVRPRGVGPRAAASSYGANLAEALAGAFASARFEAEVDLVNLPLAVDLPPIRLPMGSARLRFSPLATWWIGPRRSHLHLLRFGPACLVGFPGDVAGHLVARLRAPMPVVATSFDGDYKGYLVSRDTFLRRPCYETRWMSFFGPDLGEALADLAQRGLDRIAAERR